MSPAERKRKALLATSQALLDLLNTKPEDTISITELCQQAGVSRAYYYKHFTTFDDVLSQAILMRNVDYLRSLPPVSSSQTSVMMTRYFQMIIRESKLNLILFKVGKQDVLLNSFGTVQEYLYSHGYIELAGRASINRSYWVDFLAGAVVNMSKQWLQTGVKETPEQMGRLVADFLSAR
ncbi:TetR/AcrR family transcriptional regulator [Secundilactobacillus silagei]|uniref:TetR family transcriptional regulator n=1 Tax=Secundilactobacillus silagei JCM 19001 TaxID=1302250 RepID=A0A1Z5II73_9LACO|nr:TetR/AcrR family transcriptional regulator [Secundilactobacillus silagei]TDG67395.1 hypothetical protein C5L25_000991 [Secundilactobacillus silagei JCM 19001]GAX01338.1 TetR family transcriptional regulator [Secundilactobacillus silagei JCM 19001]